MSKVEKKAAPVERDEFQEKTETAAAMQIPQNAPAPEYDDLPEEVKKQLIGYEDIELEKQLFDCVTTAGKGVINVDKIIVALWHRHKKVADRNKVLRTLNAMVEHGIIIKHQSPRGYSLPGVEA